MFDHVTIRVEDRAAAEAFFAPVLSPLGVEPTFRTNSFTAWHDFLLAEADAEHPVTRGLHVGFQAPSREQVDAFWEAGRDAGYVDDGAPGPRPQYDEDYYGGFLQGPGELSVEAVHTGRPRRPEAIVDHVWMRVADLPAATAFYRLVAEAVGLVVRHEAPDRTTLAGRDGGSLTLVAGEPTTNVHLAFPGDDAAVERFYTMLTSTGYRGNGAPGERPQYHPGYVGAYVLDPDGNNIEVVDHHWR